jgi:tRNA (guanine37-N1)-methyltransferase
VRAWCVVVPPERGEEVRRRLMDLGVLHKHLRIVRDGDRLFIPTTARVDLDFPTDQRDFGEGFVAVRSYKDVVEVPEPLRRSLPSSFDVIGDIAVLKIPNELQRYREEIGRAILRWNPKMRVVVQDRGVKGDRRVRSIEVIAGERRTTTVHTEHGLRYAVDLAHAYFSPRLASERQRIANQVLAGETVADPFAGVGPYAILIAKRRRPRVVHASDVNPAAVALLRANVRTNRIDLVATHEGDARQILERIRPVDRVILDLPHTAFDHLGHAFAALGARGVVHVYRILERADERAAADCIRAIAAEAGMEVKDLRLHTVRAYSPTQHHVAFDVTVARVSRRAGLGTSPSVSRTSRMKATPTPGRRPGRTVRRSAPRGPRKPRSTRRR